MTTHVRSQLIQ